MFQSKRVVFVLALVLCSSWRPGVDDTASGEQAIPDEVTFEPVVYGQRVIAPLPCLGAGFKICDWDGDGRKDLLSLSHPRYLDQGETSGPFKLFLCRNEGSPEKPLFAPFDESQELLVDFRLGRFFTTMDFNDDGRAEIASVSRSRNRCQ